MGELHKKIEGRPMEYDQKFVLKLYKYQKEWKIRERIRSRNLRKKMAMYKNIVVETRVMDGLERFINNKDNNVVMKKKEMFFFGFMILLVIILMVLFYIFPEQAPKGANTAIEWLKLGSSKIGSLIQR